MIFDTHQHFWKYDLTNFDWITAEMKVLKKDYEPEHILRDMTKKGIFGSIAVQAKQSENETDYLINLSSRYPMIKGVVGWVDLCDSNVDKRIKAYSSEPIIKGFRHILQDEPDGFMSRPDFLSGMESIQKYDLCYDILVRENQLKETIQMIKKFPHLKFCLNHLAKPRVSNPPLLSWIRDMDALSMFPNVYCKLSGLVTEANDYNWSIQILRPYINYLMESFGPFRLMIGSDWPVCLLAANYSQVMDLNLELLSELSSTQVEAVKWKNAMEFYNI